jgi:hypothetical protein
MSARFVVGGNDGERSTETTYSAMLSSLSYSSLSPEGNFFFDEDIFGVDDGQAILSEAGGLFLASGVHESHDHFTMTGHCDCSCAH